MQRIEIDKEKYIESVKRRRSPFSTERHELAYEISHWLGESYSQWCRELLGSKMKTAFIRREYETLKYEREGLTMKQKAKMLMAELRR